jgi:hypothetical protein
MIREARGQDVPAIVSMVVALQQSTRIPMAIDEAVVRQTLQRLIVSPTGLLLVSGAQPEAFLAASVGFTTVSTAPVAQEHGWWASGKAKGAGPKLLLHFEKWAAEQGCQFIRMSTPPHNVRAAFLLQRRGFSVVEHAWVKAV